MHSTDWPLPGRVDETGWSPAPAPPLPYDDDDDWYDRYHDYREHAPLSADVTIDEPVPGPRTMPRWSCEGRIWRDPAAPLRIGGARGWWEAQVDGTAYKAPPAMQGVRRSRSDARFWDLRKGPDGDGFESVEEAVAALKDSVDECVGHMLSHFSQEQVPRGLRPKNRWGETAWEARAVRRDRKRRKR